MEIRVSRKGSFASRKDMCVSRKKNLPFPVENFVSRRDVRVSRKKNLVFPVENFVSRKDVRVVSLLRFLNWVL